MVALAVAHTTTKGHCRKCKGNWPVPKPPLTPDRIKRIGSVSFIEGLPTLCPFCRSPQISYIFDRCRPAGCRLCASAP